MHVALVRNGHYVQKFRSVKEQRQIVLLRISKGEYSKDDTYTTHALIYNSFDEYLGYDKNGHKLSLSGDLPLWATSKYVGLKKF